MRLFLTCIMALGTFWISQSDSAKAKSPTKDRSQRSLLQQGLKLLRAKACTTCHSLNGSRLTGPSLYKLYRKKRRVLVGKKWREVLADESYLRRSILYPRRELVQGYEQILMPMIPLTKHELNAILAVIRALGTGRVVTVPSKPKVGGAPLLHWLLLLGVLLLLSGLGIVFSTKCKNHLK